MRVRVLFHSSIVGLALLAGGTATAERARIALLPIAVHSAERDAAYVSAGLADMLSARLERTGRLAVVRLKGPAVGGDEAAAVAAARESGAGYVLFGSFTQFGQGASLDVHCAPVADDAGPGTRKIFIQAGTIGDIIPRLDDIAEKVARYVATGGAATPSVAAGEDAGASSVQELRRRVEALERELYRVNRTAAAAEGAPSESVR